MYQTFGPAQWVAVAVILVPSGKSMLMPLLPSAVTCARIKDEKLLKDCLFDVGTTGDTVFAEGAAAEAVLKGVIKAR